MSIPNLPVTGDDKEVLPLRVGADNLIVEILVQLRANKAWEIAWPQHALERGLDGDLSG